MHCVIPGRFVKLFGKSIHCLSKIGDELYIEAVKDGLALRTVNSSRSAYGCFFFNENFFHEFTSNAANSADRPEESRRFKISMKSCLGVFKSLNTIDKTVDTCQLEYDHKKTRVVFKLFCRHGITKTHNLTFQDSESLQAVFSRDLCPNLIVAQAKLLLDTAANFQNSCEEVTLGCCAESLKFKNYVEDEPDPSKVVHTEMMLEPEEFDNYQIGLDADITFCLKEAKAVLSFCEFASQPVNIQFSCPGKPVVLSLDGDSLYTADVVLATLMDQVPSQAGQDKHNAPFEKLKSSKARKNASKAVGIRRNMSCIKVAEESDAAAAIVEGNGHHEDRTAVEERSFATPVYHHHNSQTDQLANIESEKMPSVSRGDDFFSASYPYQDLLVDTSAATTERPLVPSASTSSKKSQRRNSSRDVAMPCLGDSLHHGQDAAGYDSPRSDEDVLPTTPPSKRLKSIFFGTVADADQMKLRKLRETILAADTDDES